MKVVRVNSVKAGSNTKTAAFFDVQTEEGVVLKGFRLVNGANGLFMAAPSEKGKDGKYYDSIVIPKEMKDELQQHAIEEYNKVNQ